MVFFLILTSRFCDFFQGLLKAITMIGTSESFGVPNHFFSVFGRGCIMQSCSYQPFLLVFRISRTGPVLSPKICGNSLSERKLRWQGNIPHKQKGKHKQDPRCSQPYLTIQQCMLYVVCCRFFFLVTARGPVSDSLRSKDLLL